MERRGKIDRGCPPCPNANRYSRQPGEEACPRSDTYRAIESGNAQATWGWLFRCRTCKTMFFKSTREMAQHSMRKGG